MASEIEAHNKIKSHILNSIVALFDEISFLLNQNINAYENVKLKEYVLSIINQSSGGWKGCDTIDKLIYNCKVGNSALCRIANLLWWSKQDNLQYMMSMVNDIDVIGSKLDTITELFKVAGHTIEYPFSQLSKSIPGYVPYDDQRSNFIDIFASEEYDNGTLCEIRLLSIDEAEGKIYIYYK